MYLLAISISSIIPVHTQPPWDEIVLSVTQEKIRNTQTSKGHVRIAGFGSLTFYIICHK